MKERIFRHYSCSGWTCAVVHRFFVAVFACGHLLQVIANVWASLPMEDTRDGYPAYCAVRLNCWLLLELLAH